jgi:hypothetical protein
MIDDDSEFLKRTQDYIDKYQLQLDEHGRNSIGISLFDKMFAALLK